MVFKGGSGVLVMKLYVINVQVSIEHLKPRNPPKHFAKPCSMDEFVTHTDINCS